MEARKQNQYRVSGAAGVLPQLLKVADVAHVLNITPRSVETLIAAGKLRPLWIGGVRRFESSEILELARQGELRWSSEETAHA